MKSDNVNIKKSFSCFKTRFYGIVVLCGLLMFLSIFIFVILKQYDQNVLKPKPPDLSQSTRIEIWLNPSILDYFLLDGFDPNFLCIAETEYLQSLEKLVIDDKKIIKEFAGKVSSGPYKQINAERPVSTIKSTLGIACYRNDEPIAFVTNYVSSIIITDRDENIFEYNSELPSLFLHVSHDSQKLISRLLCGGKLWYLYDELHVLSKSINSYPIPTKWCDIIVQGISGRDDFSEKYVSEYFRCPSVGEGKCHYAMNPNCGPDSPSDMVLLFETKAGWNQHGGPELFSFDNHKSKRPAPDVLPSRKRSNGGGCVLLNDGTVKFIRTEDELHALRWK